MILLTWQGSGIIYVRSYTLINSDCSTGLEVFIPGTFDSYKATAVHYINTNDVVMRSKLSKIRKSGTTIIVLHHYDLDKVLQIFKMVSHRYIYVAILQNLQYS